MCSPADSLSCFAGRSDARRLEALEAEICALAAHLAAATCRWLRLVAEFDERRGWADWGAKSCAQWLSWRCSIGGGTAREHVRVARRLAELPLAREAFGAGELTYCKVRAISRVAAPETEAELVELARHATGAQVERLVRLYRGALSATTEQAQEVHERRELTHSWNDDGSLTIHARMPPEDGAIVLAALRAAEAAAAENVPAGTPDLENVPAETPSDTAEARSADALVAIARSSLTASPSATVDGEPCEVVVHADIRTLGSEQVHERCELADGPAIAPETLRRLGCDGSIVRIIEREGRPLSVGRRRRAVPAPLRRALRSRDNGCRFPGCTHGRFLHAHHIQHWARGGPTKLDNLVQLCSYHHRLVHEGGFCVEHTGKHGLRFRRPDGQLIAEVNLGRAPRGAGLEAQHRAQGLRLDAETCKPRSLGDRLDYDIAVEGLCARASPPPGRASPPEDSIGTPPF